jgi:putative DNA primase/helicase
MSAESIARELGGRKSGLGWVAFCPAHDDRVPSLSICEAPDGKILVHCHAGCDQHSVIGALKSLGLWDGAADSSGTGSGAEPNRNQRSNRCDVERTAGALQIWQASKLGEDTLLETYLRSRGIKIAVPDTLRFHPSLRHPSGQTLPAMVALVARGVDSRPTGIHRTFLRHDGDGKAPVQPTKMMLGPCRGGAVRLGLPDKVLLIGEGIETCLAAMQATGLPAWAALSTSGLRSLDLPNVDEVIILADGDDAGEAAARSAAQRWRLKKRRVRIAHAPKGYDFNDLLLGLGPTNRKYAA